VWFLGSKKEGERKLKGVDRRGPTKVVYLPSQFARKEARTDDANEESRTCAVGVQEEKTCPETCRAEEGKE